MNRTLITALIALSTVVSVGLSAGTASAATNPWTWNDNSTQVTHRTQRPVWAMAYASPYWFYTDGLELWDGGQVYRTDGTNMTNVTLNVRNAGLSRVDEIVTDGRTVVFLKNIYRLDNTVEAVAYRDGTYSNITSEIRKPLDSNEGISSIVGRNGTWVAVTTRARFVKYSETLSTYTRITMPSEVTQLSSSDASLLYSSHDRYDRGWDTYSQAGITVVPVGSKFLMSVDERFHSSSARYVNFYQYDGYSVTNVSRPSTYTDNVYAVGANQTDALVLTDVVRAGGRNGEMYSYNGTSWVRVSNDQWFWTGGGAPTYSGPTFTDRSNFDISWNGTRWTIISGKDLFQVYNNNFEKIGPMRDYFLTSASNGAGTSLIGGAASVLWNSQPSFPLYAKLMKVTEGYIAPVPPTDPVGSAYGITASQWFDPSVTTIRRDQSATYTVSAQRANGLSRVEIWVNGVVRKTCTLAATSANQTCSFTLSGYDYNANTQVAVNAKIVGRSGEYQQLWTPVTYMYVSDTTTNTNAYSITASQSFTDSDATITRDQGTTYTV
ncbi:MAG: hypothetical protein V1745_00280, partial [Patescibacteria group bacterium]